MTPITTRPPEPPETIYIEEYKYAPGNPIGFFVNADLYVLCSADMYAFRPLYCLCSGIARSDADRYERTTAEESIKAAIFGGEKVNSYCHATELLDAINRARGEPG